MTRHRLVRCQAAALFTEASRRHIRGQPGMADTGPAEAAGAVSPWLGRSSSARPVVCWRLRLPGGRWLDWWLEVEQGANGVLAHLSALPSSHLSRLLRFRLSRLALEAWTAHELAVLGRGAESADSAPPNLSGSWSAP
jgi:hypothetical protein